MSTNNYLSARENRKPSRVTKFLWWCAGADSYFFQKSPKQVRVKYAGIGGIVFATGVLAMASGWLAFFTEFGNKSMGGQAPEPNSSLFLISNIIFAIAWGMMIFYLYRFIVLRIGKGDGTAKITWGEYKHAIPSIIIGFLLSFIISKPLEIKMLEPEINVKLNDLQNQELEGYNKATTKRFEENLQRIDQQISKIEEARSEIVAQEIASEKEYIDQIQGLAGAAKGVGPIAADLKKINDEWKRKVEEFDARMNPELERLRKQRKEKLDSLDAELAYNKNKVKELDGILTRIKISHEMISPLIDWLSIFILIGPIYFKMMMPKVTNDTMTKKAGN